MCCLSAAVAFSPLGCRRRRRRRRRGVAEVPEEEENGVGFVRPLHFWRRAALAS